MMLVASGALALAAILCAACSEDRPRGAPSGAPARSSPAAAGSAAGSAARAPAAPGFDACGIGVRALEQIRCANPDDRRKTAQLRQSLAGIVDTIRKTNLGDAHQLQIGCAQMIQAMERDATSLRCELALTAGERTQLTALLDAWYAQRTPVTPTGDPGSDEVIARIVVVRDAMCACADLDCLARVDRQLDTIGTFPGTAPQAARDLGIKLLDDVGRCGARIKHAAAVRSPSP